MSKKVRKYKNQRAMSFDEVSLKLWESEGKKGKPLSREAIRRIEQRAIEKVKLYLANQGFEEEDIVNYLSSLATPMEYEVIE